MYLASYIKKAVSAFLLVVFTFGVTPPEYLHDLFAGHHDDIDPILKKGESVMLPKHKHCSFLGFAFAPFTTPEPVFYAFERKVTCYTLYVERYVEGGSYHQRDITFLRGPPAGELN